MSFEGSCLVLSSDINNIEFALVSIKSFYLHNDKSIKSFILISDDVDFKIISGYLHQSTEILFVDETKLEGVKFRSSRPLSRAAYYRLLIPELLPSKITKALYIDTDVLVRRNIEHLFDLDISNYILAAVEDITILKNEHRAQMELSIKDKYFCSGFMLLNINKWRNEVNTESLISWSKKNRLVFFHDQDVLNFFFKKKWLELPRCYNTFIPFNYVGLWGAKINYNSSYSIHFYHYYKPWNSFYSLNSKLSFFRKEWSNLYFDIFNYNNKKIKINSSKFEILRWQISISLWNLSLFFRATALTKTLINIKNKIYEKI
jgi:lipopolysaccharide biosynthesis glycosyltransferase